MSGCRSSATAGESQMTSACTPNTAAATPQPERSWIVSVGRYALRGVGRSQELFTLDPERL